VQDRGHRHVRASYSAGNRISLGYVPARRIRDLVPDPAGTRRTETLTLAALDRPEVAAPLVIRIPSGKRLIGCAAPNTCSVTGTFYTVEFRQVRGWDRAIPRDGVLVHHVGVSNGTAQSSLMTQPEPDLQPGSRYQDAAVTVRVDAVDAANSVATVTITY